MVVGVVTPALILSHALGIPATDTSYLVSMAFDRRGRGDVPADLAFRIRGFRPPERRGDELRVPSAADSRRQRRRAAPDVRHVACVRPRAVPLRAGPPGAPERLHAACLGHRGAPDRALHHPRGDAGNRRTGGTRRPGLGWRGGRGRRDRRRPPGAVGGRPAGAPREHPLGGACGIPRLRGVRVAAPPRLGRIVGDAPPPPPSRVRVPVEVRAPVRVHLPRLAPGGARGHDRDLPAFRPGNHRARLHGPHPRRGALGCHHLRRLRADRLLPEHDLRAEQRGDPDHGSREPAHRQVDSRHPRGPGPLSLRRAMGDGIAPLPFWGAWRSSSLAWSRSPGFA